MRNTQLRTVEAAPAERIFSANKLPVFDDYAAFPADKLRGPVKIAVIFYLGVGSWALLAIGAAVVNSIA